MKRKRAVKLLMSMGYSRNEAGKYLSRGAKWGYPYRKIVAFTRNLRIIQPRVLTRLYLIGRIVKKSSPLME